MTIDAATVDAFDPWSLFIAAVAALADSGRPGLTFSEALAEAIAGWIDEQAALFQQG